jgi:hypothetical protein
MNHSRLRLTLAAVSIAACLHVSAHEVTRTAGVPVAGEVPARSYIRAVLLAGKLRSPRELNAMTAEDQRNALIVELAGRTNQPVAHFQALDDAALAGAGALLVFLRETRIRGDRELKMMGEDELRGAVIAALGPRFMHDPKMRHLDNMDLVRMALGIAP